MTVARRRPTAVRRRSTAARWSTPAVVALLTNGFRVPASAITATALDLAARGWVRLAVVDDELVVVTRGQGAAGDSLQPYEQQVLSHLMSRAFNDVSSAGTLAMSQHRLDRRWRTRFGHSVAAHAQSLGLSASAGSNGRRRAGRDRLGCRSDRADVLDHPRHRRRRRRLVEVAVDRAARAGWRRRAGAGDVRLAPSRPTNGPHRSAANGRRAWMAYRRRLRARIPARGHRAGATATAVGVGGGLRDGRRRAGARSAARSPPRTPATPGARPASVPHIARIHYPIRPGYGQHPAKVAAIGVVVLLARPLAAGLPQRLVGRRGSSRRCSTGCPARST